MKLASVAAAALALAASAPALAGSSFLVDFERDWPYGTDVNGYYAGGTADDGSSGPNRGVSFVNVSGLSNDSFFTYFSGAPSMLGTAFAHTFGTDDRAFMNVAGGVDNALSFFYASPQSITGAVRAYSGVNGTGSLLGSFNLLANASNAYDAWTQVTFAFAGTARSFDWTGSANVVGLDNIQAIAAPVPEPSTVLLMLLGGAAVLRQTTRRGRKAS